VYELDDEYDIDIVDMIPITRKRTRKTTRNEHSKSKVKSNY